MEWVRRHQLLIVGLVLASTFVGGLNFVADGGVANVFAPVFAPPTISPAGVDAAAPAWSVAALVAAPQVAAAYSEPGRGLAGASYLGSADLASPADPAGSIPLLISLQFSNGSRLVSLLANLTDPSSPQYHHFLSAAEFTDEFGGNPSVYRALVDYLGSFGVTSIATHADRLAIGFSATPEQIAAIFHTGLGSYLDAHGRPFYAPLNAPTVPSPLAPYLLDVEGLSDYSQYQHSFAPLAELAPVRLAAPAPATPRPSSGPASLAPGGSGNPFASTSVTSNGLTNTYDRPVNFNLSTQSGKTCDTTTCGDLIPAPDLQVTYNETGLFQRYGYPVNATVAAILWSDPVCTSASQPLSTCGSAGLWNHFCTTLPVGSSAWDFFLPDVTSFWNYSIPAGEPMPRAVSMPISGFTYAYPAGSQGYSASCDSGEAEGENTVDVDMLGAMAPGANVYQVFGGAATNAALDTVFSDILSPTSSEFSSTGGFDTAKNIADLANVSVITNSWTGGALPRAWYTDLESAAARGITVLAATGDAGTTIAPPAEIANNTWGAVAVGGTTVAINASTLVRGPAHTAVSTAPYYGVGTGEIGWYEPAGTVAGFTSTYGSTGGVSTSTAYGRANFVNASADASGVCNAVLSGNFRCEPDVAGIANDTIVDVEVGAYSLNFTCWVSTACTKVAPIAVGTTTGSSPTVGGTYFVGTSIATQVVGGEIAVIDHALFAAHQGWVGYGDPTFYALGQMQSTGDLALPPFYDVSVYTGAGGITPAYEAKAGFDLATGWGVVDAGNFSQNVLRLPLSFTESGLPGGTRWSVTVTPSLGDANCTVSGSSCSNAQTRSTTGSSISFSEPYGAYAYTVGGITGYSAAPASGSTRVQAPGTSVGIVFSPVTYAVTFSQTGLPGGTLWSVTLGGNPQSSTTASIVFAEPDGTYAYSVLPIAGYLASPASGSVTVSNAPQSVPVSFRPATYGVSFTEHGLPAGASWSVTFNGTTSSSTGTTIGFTVANGSYPYSIGAIAGYTASPSSGTVLVDGAAVSVPVAFTQVTYAVTFTESGLPSSTTWSVTLNGQGVSGSTASLAFSEPNGSYPFAVTPIAGYTAAPHSGTVVVAGAPVAVAVTFSRVTYPVTFTESGLPGGTTWSVDLAGDTNTSTSASIGFTAANGTYAYSVGAVPGYTVAPNSGSVLVAGAGATVAVTYTRVVYTITFTDSGLPLGTDWSVDLAGDTLHSTGASITFAEPNGTYAYTVGPVPGYTATVPSGAVTVAGNDPTVTVGFTVVRYAVTFDTSGLPSGTAWSVTFNGTTSGSTGSSIVFSVPNGTYAFTVGSVPGYAPTPGSGPVTVGGAPVSVAISFRVVTYSVTFTESGLPTGTAWTVTLGGAPNSTTGTTLGFVEPNGSYPYTVGGIAGFTVDRPSGTVVVAGANVTVALTFARVTYPVVFQETGLPAGTAWSVTLNGDLGSGTGASISFAMPNGTYPWTIGHVAGFTSNVSSGPVTVNGAGATIDVGFAPNPVPHYVVTFTESGLVSGTAWSVTFNGTTAGATVPSIPFSVENGTYAFGVAHVPGYAVNDSGGTVTVAGAPVAVAIGFARLPPPTYTVQFEESGLPSGTTWSVTFNGSAGASSSAAISFSAENGSYPFSVGGIAGYSANVTSGTVTVNGAAVTVAIGFHAIPPATYSVTFYESGLAPGTSWSVTVAGSTVSSTTGAIGFTEPNGTYPFSVGSVPGYAANVTAGTVAVAGGPAAVAIGFSPLPAASYLVTFTLPHGVNPRHVAWTVTLNGASRSTSTGALSFNETNGSYRFTVVTAAGYVAVPSSGSVVVAGAPLSVPIAITPQIVVVHFGESGLAAGARWTVHLNGTGTTTTGRSVNFTVPEGSTYPYLVTGPGGERVTGIAPAGAVVVGTAPVNESVTFVRGPTYAFTFTAVGLARGQTWCVAIAAAESCTTKGTTRLVALSPGTYSYRVLTPSVGQRVTAISGNAPVALAGNETLSTQGVTIHLRFAYPYAITFQESGLPNGTTWGIRLGGTTETATNATLVFDEKNGTYGFRIVAETGFRATRSVLRAHVAGGPARILITFSPVAHSGLPSPAFAPPSATDPARPWMAVVDGIGARLMGGLRLG